MWVGGLLPFAATATPLIAARRFFCIHEFCAKFSPRRASIWKQKSRCSVSILSIVLCLAKADASIAHRM